MSTRPSRAGVTPVVKQIRASLRFVIVVLIALAALAAVMSARPSETAPAALDAVGGGSTATALPAAAQSDPPAAASDSLPINRVPDARAAAQRRMIDEFGPPCMIEGDVDIFVLPGAARKLDEKITVANVSGEGWVVDGKLWPGSPERAAKAFGASTLYADDHSIWMFIVTGNVPRARELHRSQSESGKVTWEPLNQISACASGNPEGN